jgi:hypothetical protein
MNPFFAFAAIFALGLRGIENKTPLPYGPINSAGVTRETLIKLPTSLESATAAFKREGSLAREVLGDYFVDHFAGTREHELEMHRKAVTSWEGGFLVLVLCGEGVGGGMGGRREGVLVKSVEALSLFGVRSQRRITRTPDHSR